MASVNYIYSVANDTLNGKVNPVTLSQEIRASIITIALDYVQVVGDVLNIWFKATISATEVTELGLVLAAHMGTMGVAENPDTVIAQLTLEGRNLLARAKVGDVAYRQLGWQLGRGGYQADRPVKVAPFIDNATESLGYFELLDNTNWSIGTYISLNGKQFIYGTHFIEGITPEATIRNIQNAVLDSVDARHYRVVNTEIDPAFPTRLYINSLITGSMGNTYPISVYHVGATINIGVSGTAALSTMLPLAGGISASLEDAAWPIPPTLAPYSGTEGLIEIPSSTALSFMSRIGEGIDGMGAYGELGLWVEILDSRYTTEIGNRVLFAMSHFPIQPKTDRTILTFRVVVSF
jgi:hypothetical protein